MQKTTFSKYKNTAFAFLSISLGIILSSYFRLDSYLQTQFANGWDSYFYLIQLKSYIESGEMHSSDLSLIYPLMIGIQHFVGDYVSTFKFTALLLIAISLLCSFLVGLRITKKTEVALVLSSFFCFSPHLTYFASQYPKNLLGFIFFLLLIPFIPFNKQAKLQNRIAKYALFFLILLLNYFGHRMTFILSILLVASYFVIQKASPKTISALAISFFLLVGLGGLFPGLLSLADFERLEGLLTSVPQFAPYSFWQSFGRDRISTAWKLEIAFISIAFFFNIAYGFYSLQKPSESNTPARKPEIIGLSLTAICLLLIFPFFKWSLEGIAYRAFLVFMLIVPIAFALNLNSLLAKKHFLPYGKAITGFAWSLIFLLLAISPLNASSYKPEKHDPPYLLYAKISERVINQMDGKELELLICHKSLAEYFTFTTGIDALPWLPEYEIQAEKLWRVATDIPNRKIQQYLTQSNQQKTKKLSIGYYLIREDSWQAFLNKLQKNRELETLHQLETWRNPNKMRPSYLLKGKK
jgi:hypothetical protein